MRKSNQTYQDVDNRITALYARLSKEDENVGDSDSIVNQKEILTKYAQDNGFHNTKLFVDDGYSGVGFNRPAIQEVLKLIEQGKVATLITKDLSRFGRNYIEVGNYTEIIFPRLNVRYIAINDNYDTASIDGGNDLAPIKNFFNEWYAKDTSKKIKAVLKAKSDRGERVGSTVPYGYMHDPDRKNHLLKNDETAPVVQLIYKLCVEGNGPQEIARILKEKEILKPSMYEYYRTGKISKNIRMDLPYEWSCTTISDILNNEIYLGHTINFKTKSLSFKDKRTIPTSKEEQALIENTHEALISQEQWDIVRKIRKGKRKKSQTGIVNKYNGFVFCADCKEKMYVLKGSSSKGTYYSFNCSRYRKHWLDYDCTPHAVRESVLDEIVLEEIRKASYLARMKADEFKAFINKKSSVESRKELLEKSKELTRLQIRSKELDTLFKKLYEDNVLGKITDRQFQLLSSSYNTEQEEAFRRIPALEEEIEKLKSLQINTDKFIELANKYTDITELNIEILRIFISRIEIHERSKLPEGSSTQQIDIYFNHVGNVKA
ncbi:MAG: DUF4368 domain-containing protein [Ruminococcaceae bacterium]|nr:DUF4368 domain-containing protein [Oscillospiraceae bacterium]